MNSFKERLYELRNEAGISRSALAQKLNVSSRLISYWETGKRECSFDMLISIANLFDTSIDYLLGKSDY